MKLNNHYFELQDSYLFAEIESKTKAFKEKQPNADLIRLGIGDVTLPLAKPVITALHNAVDDMASADTFKGYGPYQGYDFLRQAIVDYYGRRDVMLELDEIFVSDGAKSDCGNITDIFAPGNNVLVPDPVYPVYVDTNIMAGSNISYVAANQENNFLPMPDPSQKVDVIYLCSPNNPTGAAYTKEQLKVWVDYANDQQALILFDAAYECFITDPDVPHSIFEIAGAKTCAIEFCSLSKTAGFTGVRCGFSVVPKQLIINNHPINEMWLRRQSTKFNGVSYIVQKGAAAVYSPQGFNACLENISYYKQNAQLLAKTMEKLGIWYCGGTNSPYIWFKAPKGLSSWEFFDKLLNEQAVVCTPGAGFGTNGEGYIRLTGFGNAEQTKIAAKRFEDLVNTL